VRRREAILSLSAAVLVLLALMAVFAIELSNTQAKSKQDVEARVHERAVLAGALIDSLFGSIQQTIPRDAKLYGTATVTARTLDQHAAQSSYLALRDSSGRLIAASSGFNPQAAAATGALALVRAGHPYGLGNLVRNGRTNFLGYAVSFPTRYGARILETGFSLSALGSFLQADLRKIPGVSGSHNYVIDGRDTVLASTNPARPAGYTFVTPGSVAALGRASGDRNGHYYDQVPLANSTWRIVLTAPDGPLFASVSGLRKWIPWIIFAAFALAALLALALSRRVLRAANQVRDANARLAAVNAELESTNASLERRAAELARSNSELDMFASIASHDLQEPLRKIRTFTQQLTVIEAGNLSDKGSDYLERTNRAAARMQKLIEDLLRFSRVATHGRPFAPVDLAAVTNEVIGDLEAQIERAHAVITVGELPTISADALQMRQLMQNLISNAIKFRRPGVTPEVTISAQTRDDHVQITVRDNGIGFEQQYSRRIFRVFERLNGRTEYPGTGIGLALCRKIAERHGGTVVAESELGAGSAFTVTLPLHQAEEVIVPSSPPEHEPEAARREAHASA
jgi:signal transduction histidine kinase